MPGFLRFLVLPQQLPRGPSQERVVALTINGVAAAFPYATLKQQRVIHYTVGEQDLVVFFKPGARSALDRPVIADSTAVGARGSLPPLSRAES